MLERKQELWKKGRGTRKEGVGAKEVELGAPTKSRGGERSSVLTPTERREHGAVGFYKLCADL